MCRSGSSTTAPATTGPARHPRPTSSTPATYTNPTRRSAFSSVRIAGTRVRLDLRRFTSARLQTSNLCLFPLVLDARGLAFEIAQVIQLRAPDLRRPHRLDLLDRRRVERKNALDPLPERHFAHCERRARAAAMQADHDAFEDLDALLVAFAHFHVHADRVARPHVRPLGQLRLFHQL